MLNANDRIQIQNKIIAAANLYKATMVGKTFMYVFDNRYIEVIYRAKDFLHLTGVNSYISAMSFYKEAVRGTLRYTQFGFTPRHPYNLCVKKMDYIDKLNTVTNSQLVILENVTISTTTFRFGVTELNFTLCLDKCTDDSGVVISDNYIVRSLRAEDCFDRSGDAFSVDFIFCKNNDASKYSVATYTDEQKQISALPDAIRSKLVSELYID